MNARLTSVDYGALPAEIELSELPVLIGRGEDCQVCLDDRWVSRRHCQIEREGQGLVVRDLGSKYGTFVSGRRVRECRLEPGDILGIGLSNFIVRYEPSAPEQAAVPRESPRREAAALELAAQI